MHNLYIICLRLGNFTLHTVGSTKYFSNNNIPPIIISMNLSKSTIKRTAFFRGISLRDYLRKSVEIEEFMPFKDDETIFYDQNQHEVQIGDDFIIRDGRSDSPRREQYSREERDYVGRLPLIGVKIKGQAKTKVKRLPTDRNSTDASLADPFKPLPNFDFLDNPVPTPSRFKSRNLSSLREPTPQEPTPSKSRSLSNRKYVELIRKDVHINHCGKGEGRVVPTPKIKSHLRDFSYC